MNAKCLYLLRIIVVSDSAIGVAVVTESAFTSVLGFVVAGFVSFLRMTAKRCCRVPFLLNDGEKIFAIANRGGFTLNLAGRTEIEEALRKKAVESGWS